MLPNFIVPGAPRCGTTWLYDCFCEHPDIYVPEIKEVRFFSRDYEKGISYYETHFAGWKGEKAVGELSPTYMDHSEVPKRIYELNPAMKLIFSFRNPVERAYSDYCAALFRKAIDSNIDEALKEDSIIIQRSMYFKYLQRFIKLFPRENIKVMIFEDIKRGPDSYLADVFAFLEVDANFRPSTMLTVSNRRRPRQKSRSLIRVKNFIRENLLGGGKAGAAIARRLRKSGAGELFFKLNRGKEYPELSPAKRAELNQIFKSDVEGLSEFAGRDLTFWFKN